jgi:hypothetical protein
MAGDGGEGGVVADLTFPPLFEGMLDCYRHLLLSIMSSSY